MAGLVLVSGLPASGKSTLARRLSSDLGWPLLCRDRLRQHAFDEVVAVLPPSENWRVGRTIDLIINEMAARALDVGLGAVVDSNFNWVQQADAIRGLISERQAAAFEVCLWADAEVCRRRFIERADPPLTAELEPIFTAAVGRPREPVLTPPAPIIEVDTNDFGVLDSRYDEIRQAIATHLL